MRLIDLFFQEEAERQKDKLSKKAIKAFHEQQKVAKIVRENALKVSFIFAHLVYGPCRLACQSLFTNVHVGPTR